MFLSTRRAEVEGEQLKGRCGTESKIAADTNQEMRSNYRQADDVHVKESTSQESPMETVGSDSNNSIPVDVSHLQLVSPFQNPLKMRSRILTLTKRTLC